MHVCVFHYSNRSIINIAIGSLSISDQSGSRPTSADLDGQFTADSRPGSGKIQRRKYRRPVYTEHEASQSVENLSSSGKRRRTTRIIWDSIEAHHPFPKKHHSPVTDNTYKEGTTATYETTIQDLSNQCYTQINSMRHYFLFLQHSLHDSYWHFSHTDLDTASRKFSKTYYNLNLQPILSASKCPITLCFADKCPESLLLHIVDDSPVVLKISSNDICDVLDFFRCYELEREDMTPKEITRILLDTGQWNEYRIQNEWSEKTKLWDESCGQIAMAEADA